MRVSPAMAVLVLVSMLGYLALAVFGAGGIEAFCAHPQFAILALVTLALALPKPRFSGTKRPAT